MGHRLYARINKTMVDRLMPGDIVWDTEIRGFGARRQARSVSYFLKFRVNGRQKWITIGKHGLPWNPTTARSQALALKIDPLAHVAVKAEPSATLGGLIDRFEREYLPKLKPGTAADYTSLIEMHIRPRFGDHRLDRFARADAERMHRELSETPRRANIALAVLSRMMSWAEEIGDRPRGSNPCLGIKKYPERQRQRYLSQTELARLGTAITEAEVAGDISPQAAAAIRLLVLTGARLSEVLTLKWEFIDFERRRIFLPDSKTGQKTMGLNPAAVTVLKSLPRLRDNPFVIAGKKDKSAMVNIQKPWRIVRDKAKLDGVRLHDLRHSYASIAAASGASLPMIGKLLGHSQPQTTARYAHLADDPVDKLNRQVGTAISRAMRGRKQTASRRPKTAAATPSD